jgi:translation initiation factor IF-2
MGFPYMLQIDLEDMNQHGWDRRIDELIADLAEQGFDPERQMAPPVRGKKGAAEVVSVLIASAGTLTAFERLLRTWQTRSCRRSITVHVVREHSGRTVVVETEMSTDETIRRITEAALNERDDTASAG